MPRIEDVGANQDKVYKPLEESTLKRFHQGPKYRNMPKNRTLE